MAKSSALVNQLSEQSRDDAVRFARDELAEAEAHLRDVRQELADFRRDQNIVDPTADVASQSGLLNALNQELAQALVERDVLHLLRRGGRPAGDPGRPPHRRDHRPHRGRAPHARGHRGHRLAARGDRPLRGAEPSTSSSPTPPTPRRSPASPPPAPRPAGSRATSPRTSARRWPAPRSTRAGRSSPG